MHDWQVMLLEVAHQILHSNRFSKPKLQFRPLSQE